MELAVFLIGFAVFAVGPSVYYIITDEELQKKHMVLYTIGWIGSLPFILFVGAVTGFGAVFVVGLGNDPNVHLADLVGTPSSAILAYVLLVFVALIGGWVFCLNKRRSIAFLCVILPLFYLVLIVLVLVFTMP